jgi:alpha-N-acetylglucosamine transferase
MSRLREVGWQVRQEHDIEVPGMEYLQANYKRNYMKLRVWAWTEYKKIAVIDADCMCTGDVSLLLSDKFGKLPLKMSHFELTLNRFRSSTRYRVGISEGLDFQRRCLISPTLS